VIFPSRKYFDFPGLGGDGVGEHRVIGVALGSDAVEGGRIGLVERCVSADATRSKLPLARTALVFALSKPVLTVIGTDVVGRNVSAILLICTPRSASFAFGSRRQR
jgi:hypothetical protein